MKNISFCNNQAKIVSDISVKKDLLKVIYDNLTLSDYQYDFIKDKYDMDRIISNPYYLLVNNIGNKNLLIFTKYNGKEISYFVDKKTLNYDYANLNFNNVKIFIVRYRVSPYFYENTIFDGDLIRKFDDNWIFNINDIFMFYGKSWSQYSLYRKIESLNSILNDNYIPDSYMESCMMKVAKIYNKEDIVNIVENTLESQEYVINGITFVPEISGNKTIYLFTNDDFKINNIEDDNDVENSINLKNFQECKPKTNRLVSFKMAKDKKLPDTYMLSLLNKKRNAVDVGLAYIPSSACSSWINNMFKNSNNQDIYIACKYIEEFNKWKPIKLSEEEKVNYVDGVF